MINSYRILVGKLLVKHPLRGLRKRRKDNIKENLKLGVRVWTGSNRLRIESSVRLL